MIFIYRNNKFSGATAVEVVRAIERRASSYDSRNGSVRAFLLWSLARMADRIPPRELDVSPDLDDETIAFNYLCLLDSCRIGAFYQHVENYSPAVEKQTKLPTES